MQEASPVDRSRGVSGAPGAARDREPAARAESVRAQGDRAVPDPVFIVGMNGSGTTMLLDSLGRHPRLYAFPRETRLIPYLIATHGRFGDLSDDDNFRRLWDEARGLTVFEFANGGRKPPLPADWREYPRNLAAVLDGIFRHFAAREGKQRWCEKTPHHLQHMSSLAELFPRARFLHIVRDGRDCAASFHRRWSRTPELTIFRWKTVLREGHRQGLQLGADRYLEVRYENLTTEPEYWLRHVCSFLGLPFDAAVLSSGRPYRTTADGGSGRLEANSGNWQHHFSPRRIRRLDRIGGATLEAFGYPSAAPDSDFDPSPLQRRLWSGRDSVRQYSRQIGLKLTGQIEIPWRVILSRPVVAYRHRRENRF